MCGTASGKNPGLCENSTSGAGNKRTVAEPRPIYAGDEQVLSLEALAQEAYYSLSNSSVLTAEVSTQIKKNTIATGCCFVEVEVDMKLGTIQILNIINVHDSGKLLNPQLAEMQVHGGMSMGMGYGLSEQLVLDEKQDGR